MLFLMFVLLHMHITKPRVTRLLKLTPEESLFLINNKKKNLKSYLFKNEKTTQWFSKAEPARADGGGRCPLLWERLQAVVWIHTRWATTN